MNTKSLNSDAVQRLARRCMCATVYRKRKWHPKRIIFDTKFQEEAEQCMTELGYGCDQYWLSWVDMTPPNAKARTPERKVETNP